MHQPGDHLEGRRPERAVLRGRVPVWPRAVGRLAVVGAVGALLLASHQWSSGPPSGNSSSVPAPSASTAAAFSAVQLQAMEDRARALQSRVAMIRAVPPAYQRAAERASALGHRRTPSEFFLALAYNRTMYGALLEGVAGRPFADRGPVQWTPADFRRFSVPGHDDPAVPLDAFLAVDAAVNRTGPPDFSHGAFTASVVFGATPDDARADDETYAVLSAARGRPGL